MSAAPPSPAGNEQVPATALVTPPQGISDKDKIIQVINKNCSQRFKDLVATESNTPQAVHAKTKFLYRVKHTGFLNKRAYKNRETKLRNVSDHADFVMDKTSMGTFRKERPCEQDIVNGRKHHDRQLDICSAFKGDMPWIGQCVVEFLVRPGDRRQTAEQTRVRDRGTFLNVHDEQFGSVLSGKFRSQVQGNVACFRKIYWAEDTFGFHVGPPFLDPSATSTTVT